MNKNSLLPIGSTRLERKLSLTFASISDIPVPIHLTWQAKHCPASLLPWLAWSLSVDEWDDEWSEDQKRNTILESVNIHRTKGTVASIRRVLASVGYGDITIQESNHGNYLQEEVLNPWATYQITLKKPVSINQANQVRRMLLNTAPVRCLLTALNFEKISFLYNNKITYNGQYSHGAA